jgi:hypothetical protein
MGKIRRAGRESGALTHVSHSIGIKDTIQCLRLKPGRIYGTDLPRLYRLHRHIAMDEPHMGNGTEIELAMLGNMCFDIMLASSRIFYLGHFYKVLRDINIRVCTIKNIQN